MDKSVRKTDANDNINVELDLSSNGQLGQQRKPKHHSSASVNAPTPPITPKVELEPPTSHHPPPQVEGAMRFANSASSNAPPPTSHVRIEQREAALHVALKQMKSQRPPRPPLKTITTLQMEGGNNNDDNAASQAPVLRQQAAAAVDAMNGRQLSAV